MYREAWRLQRDFFWVANMSKINWDKVYKRYKSLINRAGSRSEFSDIVWEMQGELGTSHCYEFGGDYQQGRYYNIGHLAASFKYNDKAKGYQISNIFKGDPGGFCGVWGLWYINLRLKYPNTSSEKLIKRAIKLIKGKNHERAVLNGRSPKENMKGGNILEGRIQ